MRTKFSLTLLHNIAPLRSFRKLSTFQAGSRAEIRPPNCTLFRRALALHAQSARPSQVSGISSVWNLKSLDLTFEANHGDVTEIIAVCQLFSLAMKKTAVLNR